MDDFRGKDELQLKLEHLQTHARFPEIEAHLEALKRFTRVVRSWLLNFYCKASTNQIRKGSVETRMQLYIK